MTLRTLGILFLPLVLGAAEIRVVGPTNYLNNAKAVVIHTIDDSSKFVPATIDAMDRYGIKATIFVSTRRPPIDELWPRLRQAIDNGHEIGSHSRTHKCEWPATPAFCRTAYTADEVAGSRDDILKNTQQPYVWSWAYPCGLCSDLRTVQETLAKAGYLVARTYPDEESGGHLVPDLDSFSINPYTAAYTQVVQKKGGLAKSGRTELKEINAKFDEVYRSGGIYSFMSHPQWIDFGPDTFYERHMRYIGSRADVWYVPMGPLYAYKTILEKTDARQISPNRFSIFNLLDKKMYPSAITFEFRVTGGTPKVLANGEELRERPAGPTFGWRASYYRREGDRYFVTVRPDVTLEFR